MRRLTREENIERLEWNIRDASEALKFAVEMGSFENAKKYIRQLEALHSKLFKAKGLPRQQRRTLLRGS